MDRSKLLLFVTLAGSLTACLPKASDADGSDVKIFGGDPVPFGDPLTWFTAALTKPDGRVFCTATLLTPTVLATAAHCLTPNFVDGGISVVFGPDAGAGEIHPMKNFLVHPAYTPSNSETSGAINDLGLIYLDAPLTHEYPLPILESEYPIVPYDTQLVIAGYGITNVGKGDVGTLRATATFFSNSNTKAKEVYFDGLTIHNACNGDSGGPAVLRHDGQYFVLGIASYVIITSTKVCNSGFSAYTDLRKLRPWIMSEWNR